MKIDNFFTRSAYEQHSRNQVRVFVATRKDSDEAIGFHSLCLKTYEPDFLIGKDRKHFSRFNTVPTIYLPMIGVTQQCQKRGLGSLLLRDAFRKAVHVAELAGVYALTLDAATDDLVSFYAAMGFTRMSPQESERTMFIPIKDIAAAARA